VSCQLAGNTAIGASTKNPPTPPMLCKIAFHASAPAALADAALTIVAICPRAATQITAPTSTNVSAVP